MDMFNDFNTKKTKMKRLIITIFMVVAGLATVVAQTTHDIKGVVTDKNNEPIVGALVTVENTNISTITDVDGKFLLQDVPIDAKKIVVESIGMETTKIKTDQPLMMALSPKRLSLVVEAGFDWSRYTAEGGDTKTGYHVGIGMEVRMSKRWAFRPMIQLANRGTEYNFADGSYYYKETWNPMMLDVPLNFLVRYKLARNMSFVFSFGPVFSYGIGGKTKITGTDMEDTEYDIYSGSQDKTGHALLNPFSLGFNYGVGIEYRKFMINFSGKNMLLDSETGYGQEHNFVLGTGVSYRF